MNENTIFTALSLFARGRIMTYADGNSFPRTDYTALRRRSSEAVCDLLFEVIGNVLNARYMMRREPSVRISMASFLRGSRGIFPTRNPRGAKCINGRMTYSFGASFIQARTRSSPALWG